MVDEYNMDADQQKENFCLWLDLILNQNRGETQRQ